MSLPVWCADLAAAFWRAAGDPPPYPRNLRPVVWCLPFTVVECDRLSVAAVARWLTDRGVRVPRAADRPLRACLVAWRGQGFAFVDAGDPEAERRFSVAHELAHFLRDYRHPRETARRRIGPSVEAVFDGDREPTPDERLHAVLRNAPTGPFTHLLGRDAAGRPASAAERESEAAADRLAFELLAPADAVGPGGRDDLTRRLVETFGLPPGPAAAYAATLAPEADELPAAIRRLIRT